MRTDFATPRPYGAIAAVCSRNEFFEVPSTLKQALFFFIVLNFSVNAFAEGTEGGLGPIPIKNHHPLYVGLLYPPPEKAPVVDRLSYLISLDHSNVYLRAETDTWDAQFDKEITEMALSARLPINLDIGNAEVGMTVPFYTSSRGYFDGVIRFWHNVTGAPFYYGQKEYPDFRYLDSLYYQDTLIIEGSEGDLFLGDITVWIKADLAKSDAYRSTFQLFVQPPTGAEEKGAGSGAWEFGVRLLISGNVEGAAWNVGGGVFFPNMLKRDDVSVPLSWMVTLFAEAEWPVYDRTNFVIQSMFNSSPMPDSDIHQFSWPWIDLTLGFSYQLENSGAIVFFGISENLDLTAPDFTFHFSIKGSL